MFGYLCQGKRKLDQDRSILCDTVSVSPEGKREPIVAGSLPPGTTGVIFSWTCPRCGHQHKSGDKTFRLVEVIPSGEVGLEAAIGSADA